MQQRRMWLAGLCVGLLAGGLSVALWLHGSLEPLERITWIGRQRLMAKDGDPRIAMILLDQASLDWGRQEHKLPWPWPREMYAMVLDFCMQAGARSAAIDILFTEPSAHGQEDDEALGQAIARWPQAVPAMLPSPHVGDAHRWPADIKPNPWKLDAQSPLFEEPLRSALVMPQAVFSQPINVGQAMIQGHVRAAMEDQVITHVLPFQIFDERIIPLLGLSAYRDDASPQQPPVIQADARYLQIGPHRLPLDEQGRTIVRYPRVERHKGQATWPYTALSMKDVLESALRQADGREPLIDPALLKDRYVLIGFSAPALFDIHTTPVDDAAPGIFVHAAALDNLLNDNAIASSPSWLVMAMTLLLAILAGCWTAAAGHGKSIAFAFVALLPLPAILGLALYPAGWWWPIVAPQLGVTGALVGGLGLNYVTLGRQRRFIRHAFERYLSPQVIARLVDNPDSLTLGGERRELTILFSDIAGFSTIAESMDPQNLTALLNDYLSDMTQIVLEHGGTLDKYQGDAFIAFWNAPLDQPDHAARAVRTALECQARLQARHDHFAAQAGRPLTMRIGINTGPVVVGNMGSNLRFDYTVLGDAANLASRLEGANKYFGTRIMMAQRTWDAARAADSSMTARRIGDVRVVGKTQAVRVYEPVDPQRLSQDQLSTHEQAMHLLDQHQYAAALDLFKQLPDDPLAALYVRKLTQLLVDPASGWDGQWNLSEK